MNETDTQALYDRQAAAFDAQRSRSLFETPWLERFARALPAGGRVLDLGCGAGEPIARWLIDRGYNLTGVDISTEMLDIARARWPQGDWRQANMRTLALDVRFDGIIGWGSFFHLTPDAQRDCLPRLAAHLTPGGTLLLTVGPEAGETDGIAGDERVYHASLSPAEYAKRLEDNGLRMTAFIAEDPDTNHHSVLMARKT